MSYSLSHNYNLNHKIEPVHPLVARIPLSSNGIFSRGWEYDNFSADSINKMISVNYLIIYILIKHSLNRKDIMDSKKTYIEELREKESSFGKIFKVSGPRN